MQSMSRRRVHVRYGPQVAQISMVCGFQCVSMVRRFCPAITLLALVPYVAASGIGMRSPAERASFTDETTCLVITRLTSSPAQDDKIYQTHPNWTADGTHLVFHSDRTGRGELFALEETSGQIVQLTEGDAGALVVARQANAMYLVQNSSVVMVNLGDLLADSRRGVMQPAAAYRRHIAELPVGCTLSGTYTEDADGKSLYFGLVDSAAAHSIQKLDLASGQFAKVIGVDFRVGHCQAHPTSAGLISYCYETGGDAPQRMWLVRSDGSDNRPFYKETYDEWVTHEVWWTADRMLFTIWPKNAAMRALPHGIASIGLSDFRHQIHDQHPYWHVCGTPDGKYAVGDTFDGELFLIDIASGRRRLLTQGHRPDGATSHQHQSVSPDGKRILFVSSKFGNWDLMTVEVPSDNASGHGL